MASATETNLRPVAAASGWRVWGQDAAVETLQRAARTRPRHAYVLAGPEHAGKRSLALEFALALNCPEASDGALPHPAYQRPGLERPFSRLKA